MARGAYRPWLRDRCQALPFPTCFADCSGPCLHRLHLRTCFSPVAAHSISGRRSSRPRFRQRQHPERSWHFSHGPGMVRIRPAPDRHHRPAGHDSEHSHARQTYRRVNIRQLISPSISTEETHRGYQQHHDNEPRQTIRASLQLIVKSSTPFTIHTDLLPSSIQSGLKEDIASRLPRTCILRHCSAL